MFLKFFCFNIIVNSLWCAAWYTGAIEEYYNAKKAPLFEMPCMRVGGLCAESDACPPGMRVEHKGLCPEQQDLGMECCVPYQRASKCCAKQGRCVPKVFECSQHFRVQHSAECSSGEVCCIKPN